MTLNPFAPKKSSPWTTLPVLAATLALVVWTRHDALDTYWQQTRHSDLGLTDLSDAPAWKNGVQWLAGMNDKLGERQQQWDEIGSRMTLAANIVIDGPQMLDSLHPQVNRPVAQTNSANLPPSVATTAVADSTHLKSAGPVLAYAPTTATAVQPDATVLAERPPLPPLTEDGRIVLTPQDRVLLVGDSMMQGVAPHVARALQKANISSLDLSKQSTGLAYPSYFDWPATVQKTIPGSKITVMVVFMGANDTWDMVLSGHYEPFGTGRWQTMYTSRIDSMVKFAESQNVRVIWLGAPNMGKEKINAGVKVLNQLYKAETSDGVARYVSTRELLSANNPEEYQKHITREDGKVVTVRTDDGIHFTRDGQVMLSNLILQQFELPTVAAAAPAAAPAKVPGQAPATPSPAPVPAPAPTAPTAAADLPTAGKSS
jgi:hypothetical protein